MSRSGYSNDRSTASQGPTIEEYVQHGYPAANYPPTGYAEVDSPGLQAFRAHQADPTNAALHQAVADMLGVSVGEVTHGRVGGAAAGEIGDERAALAPEDQLSAFHDDGAPHPPTEAEASDLGRPPDEVSNPATDDQDQ